MNRELRNLQRTLGQQRYELVWMNLLARGVPVTPAAVRETAARWNELEKRRQQAHEDNPLLTHPDRDERGRRKTGEPTSAQPRVTERETRTAWLEERLTAEAERSLFSAGQPVSADTVRNYAAGRLRDTYISDPDDPPHTAEELIQERAALSRMIFADHGDRYDIDTAVQENLTRAEDHEQHGVTATIRRVRAALSRKPPPATKTREDLANYAAQRAKSEPQAARGNDDSL